MRANSTFDDELLAGCDTGGIRNGTWGHLRCVHGRPYITSPLEEYGVIISAFTPTRLGCVHIWELSKTPSSQAGLRCLP